MYASVLGWCFGAYCVGHVVNACLKNGHAALAVAASAVLLAHRSVALVRLLRGQDHLLQAVSLLVRAAVLHLRHCLLHVSEPRVRHFCLTARNKTHTTPRT